MVWYFVQKITDGLLTTYQPGHSRMTATVRSDTMTSSQNCAPCTHLGCTHRSVRARLVFRPWPFMYQGKGPIPMALYQMIALSNDHCQQARPMSLRSSHRSSEERRVRLHEFFFPIPIARSVPQQCRICAPAVPHLCTSSATSMPQQCYICAQSVHICAITVLYSVPSIYICAPSVPSNAPSGHICICFLLFSAYSISLLMLLCSFMSSSSPIF